SSHGSKFSRNLCALIALDLITDLDVVVVAYADAAFRAGAHFRHVVFEAAQRLELALEYDDIVSEHSDRIAAANVTVDHHAAGDVSESGRAEHFPNLREADDLLPNLGSQQAADRRLDVVDCLVDDAVVAHVYPAFLDRIAGRGICADVESDHDRLGGCRQLNVGLGDAPHPAADDRHFHIRRGDLLQSFLERL